MLLIDTNLFSALMKPHLAAVDPKFHEQLISLYDEGISTSYYTQFELCRGIEALELKGEGRRKRAILEMLLSSVAALGLDRGGGAGWRIAANMWASVRALKPARPLTDGDLIIAATALTHDRTLATADVGLAEGMQALGVDVRLLSPTSRVDL